MRRNDKKAIYKMANIFSFLINCILNYIGVMFDEHQMMTDFTVLKVAS